jgi:hypothetical protein
MSGPGKDQHFKVSDDLLLCIESDTGLDQWLEEGDRYERRLEFLPLDLEIMNGPKIAVCRSSLRDPNELRLRAGKANRGQCSSPGSLGEWLAPPLAIQRDCHLETTRVIGSGITAVENDFAHLRDLR